MCQTASLSLFFESGRTAKTHTVTAQDSMLVAVTWKYFHTHKKVADGKYHMTDHIVVSIKLFRNISSLCLEYPLSNVARLLCKMLNYPSDLRKQIQNEQFQPSQRTQLT
jgi:hypothetical protein